jgi:hypothetical protein
MRHRLLIAARSILLGWAALFAVISLVMRPLLHGLAPWLGASWLPTAQVVLECAALGASGWIMGRTNPLDAAPTVALFAILLAVWNFGLVPPINVPWLFRLTIDSFGNPRYLESLINAAGVHALLFGSLAAGASLSRRTGRTPLSLMNGDLG